MATITDWLPNSTNTWTGTEEDDILFFKGGDDTVDGFKGCDTLVIERLSSDSIIGRDGSSVYIETPTTATGIAASFDPTDKIEAYGIEKIQFNDKTVSLSDPIKWGTGGRWTKNWSDAKKYGWYLTKGKNKNKRYLIDKDVTTFFAGIDEVCELSLEGGSWANTSIAATSSGAIIYSGTNVIADFYGMDVNQVDAITKI